MHAVVKVDNLVVRFGFPYVEPRKTQSGFIPCEPAGQEKAQVVRQLIDINKHPRRSSIPTEEEMQPEKSEDVAAGQDPFWE
jgi:hypothetical protein